MTDIEPQIIPGCLLVDDHPIHLKVIGKHLTDLGIFFDTATNGKEALEAVKARPHPYKFIFMDVSMPVMDGLESSRLIRKFETDNQRERVHIVAMTAGTLSEQSLMDCGLDAVLKKPVRPHALRDVLQKLGGLPTSDLDEVTTTSWY